MSHILPMLLGLSHVVEPPSSSPLHPPTLPTPLSCLSVSVSHGRAGEISLCLLTHASELSMIGDKPTLVFLLYRWLIVCITSVSSSFLLLLLPLLSFLPPLGAGRNGYGFPVPPHLRRLESVSGFHFRCFTECVQPGHSPMPHTGLQSCTVSRMPITLDCFFLA